MPVIYVCTLVGSNFKMHSEPALCRQLTKVGTELFIHSYWPTLHNCSFKPSRYKQKFINIDMPIHALSDTGPIMLRRYHLCHWKYILATDTPPPEINQRPIANIYL